MRLPATTTALTAIRNASLNKPFLEPPVADASFASNARTGQPLSPQSSGPVKPGWLAELDFKSIGISSVAQIKLVFASLILWRILAANDRRKSSPNKRWNEMREGLTRDLVGGAFWLLGVPIIQRLYLYSVTRSNPEFKNILLRQVKPETSKPKHFIRKILYGLRAMNPMSTLYIPSSQQVKDQMEQSLKALEKAGIQPEEAAWREIQAQYGQFIKHRNLATALGLVSTILLLGIGINLFNIYLTRKNVAATSTGSVATPPGESLKLSSGNNSGRAPSPANPTAVVSSGNALSVSTPLTTPPSGSFPSPFLWMATPQTSSMSITSPFVSPQNISGSTSYLRQDLLTTIFP